MNVTNSFSISSEKLVDFKSLFQKKIEQYGKPSLGVLFVNADLDIRGVHEYLEEQMMPHIGCSSAGELCEARFNQGMYTGLFMYLPENSFKIYHTQSNASDLSGKELGIFAKKAFENPGVYMLIASTDSQTDLFIQDVQQHSYAEIPLYGGHALDNLKFEKYTIFTPDYFEHKGIVAVIFDCNKIEILGDAYSGWDSMGTTHTVTHSIKNELIEIDGKPALDVFANYFDYEEEDDSFITGNHPIKIIESDGAHSLKSAIHINRERKSMTFYCSIPKGTKFKFCNSPKIEITDSLIERIQGIRANQRDIDCLLITSCASRHLTLGPFFKKEVKRLFGIWEKPMAGFLSGGEIGNVTESNKSYFHNVTCVFTGFKIKTANDG